MDLCLFVCICKYGSISRIKTRKKILKKSIQTLNAVLFFYLVLT